VLCQHMHTIKGWAPANIRESARNSDWRECWQGLAELLAAAVVVIPAKGAGGDAGGGPIQAFSPGWTMKLIECETPRLHTKWTKRKSWYVQCNTMAGRQRRRPLHCGRGEGWKDAASAVVLSL
jgi:hypothetical protein